MRNCLVIESECAADFRLIDELVRESKGLSGSSLIGQRAIDRPILLLTFNILTWNPGGWAGLSGGGAGADEQPPSEREAELRKTVPQP